MKIISFKFCCVQLALVIVLLITTSAGESIIASATNDSNINIQDLLALKGAITTLCKSNREYGRLKTRNLSIQKYLKTHSELNFDVVIFHQDVMPPEHIEDLQSATPELPLIFIRVDEIFERQNRWNSFGYCKANPATRTFALGYKRMCRFWFSEFYKALQNYSWMLRIDLDCEIKEIIEPYFKMQGSVHYAAVSFEDMNGTHPDSVNYAVKFDGACVTGLGYCVNDFLHSPPYSTNRTINSWYAPYTNVFFINLIWIHQARMILDFMKVVDDSGCIFSNRWGDLPLWGAALAIGKEPLVTMHMVYGHGSHKNVVHPVNETIINHPEEDFSS